MLCNLKIENVAVIEKAEVEFGTGLNVLTGETGAGKSILIDSIHAILGERTSKDIVRSNTKRATIQAIFKNLPDKVRKKLQNIGMDAGDELSLYREITSEGQSRFRINGIPATAKVVKEISQNLIDIHGQQDSQSLMDPARHLTMLDLYARCQKQRKEYYLVYRQLVDVKKETDKLKQALSDKQKRTELLQYQLEEIDAVNPQLGEEDELIAKREHLTNFHHIMAKLSEAYQALEGDDQRQGAADSVSDASRCLQHIAHIGKDLESLSERTDEVYYTLRELCADLAHRMEEPEEQGQSLDMIEERLDLIFRLKRKYGNSIEEILQYREDICNELENMETADARLEELEEKKQQLYLQAKQMAQQLSEIRLNAFEKFNQEIAQALVFLNMPGIHFVAHHQTGPLASSGQDQLEFYISTNPGEEPKPLVKIASGGELSRIMLAIKSALADADDVDAVIYDEIDTGVSGKAAARIGQKLLQTSKGKQILCITHTAQIAALADTHLLIQKEIQNGRAYTKIRPLSNETERQNELARIIAGDQITTAALEAAKEMRNVRFNRF